MKKILSVVLALAVILSAFGSLFAVSADTAPTVLYVSADGAGDGSSADAPTTLTAATSAIADGGTIYIIGAVTEGRPGWATASLLGEKGKSINYIGYSDDAEFYAPPNGTAACIEIWGNVFVDKLKISINGTYDFSFRMEDDPTADITFGKDVTFNLPSGNEYFAVIGNNSTSDVTFDGSTFSKTVFIGGYNGSKTVDSTSLTLKNGATATGTLALAHAHNGTNGAQTYKGNWTFNVIDSTANEIVLGPWVANQPQKFQGFGKVVVSGNSSVGTIYLGAKVKENGSNGYRVAEINGGSVTKISDMTDSYYNSATYNKYQQIVILNNGTSVADIATVDTKITAPEGVFVSAIGTGSTLSGYSITGNGDKYILVNGEYAYPDKSTGLYNLGTGNINITLTDVPEVLPETVYVSDNGTGNGLSADVPTNYANAIGLVADGGTLVVKGVFSPTELGSSEKNINIKGYDATSYLAINNTVNLKGKVSFDDIIIENNYAGEIMFIAEKVANNDITFGENVVMYSNAAAEFMGAVVFNTETGVSNKLAINTEVKLGNVLAGGYNNGGRNYSENTEIIINNANVEINNLAIANGSNANNIGSWNGNYNFTVNAGKINALSFGAVSARQKTTLGTYKAVINGGSIGTLYTGAMNRDNNSHGLRIAEINGGTIGAIKGYEGGSPINSTYKTIVIMNNGINVPYENLLNPTVVKVAQGGTATAKVVDGGLVGYEITTTADKAVLVDGVVAMVGKTSGVISIAEGEHNITFANASDYEETYDGNVARTTWVERATAMLDGKTFTAGQEAFEAALFNLKTADAEADDIALIEAVRAAWNGLKYTEGDVEISASLKVYGDANGDDSINVLDLVRSKRYIAAEVGITVAEFTLDIDNDNANDGDDLVLLRKLILAQ